MSCILIVGDDVDLCKAYSVALANAGHEVKAVRSCSEAIYHLIGLRRIPDIAILDMPAPGETAIVVLGLAHRLPALAETKIVIISPSPGMAQRAITLWRADRVLAAPVSPATLTQTVHELSQGPASHTRADQAGQPKETWVWWDGAEVSFIRWTQHALVFAWRDSTETAVTMPRGAVLRLLKKGILRVEGYMPAWEQKPLAKIKRAEETPTTGMSGQSPMIQPASARLELSPGQSAWESRSPHPWTQTYQPEQRSDRLKAVARLIRKLTGGGKTVQPPTSDQAHRTSM